MFILMACNCLNAQKTEFEKKLLINKPAYLQKAVKFRHLPGSQLISEFQMVLRKKMEENQSKCCNTEITSR